MIRGPLFEMLSPLINRHRRALMVVLAMMPVASVMAMLTPYLTKVAIDDYIVPAQRSGDLAAVYQPLLGLVALAMAVVVLGYLADAVYVMLLQRVGQNIIAELRNLVYHRTLRLPRGYFDDHPIGTLLTRVTSDIEALGEGLASGALALFMDILKTIAFLAMMFALNWRLTLVLLAIVPVLTLLIWFFQRRVRQSFFVARQGLSEATGYLQEVLNGIKTVQLYGAEEQALARFKAKNARYYRAQNASNFYDATLFSLVEGITTLALALMLWYAAGELLSGIITLGVLVAFMEYIQRLFVPVREFAQQLAVLQRSMAALDHINQLFQAPLDPAETDALSKTTAQTRTFRTLEFDKVRFRYRPHGDDILKGVSFRVERGQTLAIVGATGSGKSTLIRLLTRAYGGYQGSIRINGVELNKLYAEQLSRLITVVHQNVFLFQGSVAFNIGLGRPDISRARIEQAARYVNADTFIQRLNGGYDFRIAPGGSNLSAGQAQLVALARAVANETDLIVMDEATSSVDSMTEGLIQDAIERIYHDKTVIAIAHRLSTIRKADQILVMKAGEIVETGNHAALMAQSGIYAELVSKSTMANGRDADKATIHRPQTNS